MRVLFRVKVEGFRDDGEEVPLFSRELTQGAGIKPGEKLGSYDPAVKMFTGFLETAMSDGVTSLPKEAT